MAMFLSPIRHDDPPTRKAWDNATIHDGKAFYAFFNTTDVGAEPRAYGLDIARSEDGVHWEFIARDLIPIEGAHAGYGILHVGERVYYYPTVTDRDRGIHFKIYASRDYLNWEHLGDEHDVVPDPRYYAARWEEICILREREGGRSVYYGYISSEVRSDVAESSLGLLKSADGIAWEVLPPPVVEWGELPAQHTEVNFCEKIAGRYYLSLNCRLHFDSYGYSSYTFVGDSPTGPFEPDLAAFRLTGTTTRDVTWLAHPIHTPDGPLIALWLSARQELEIPSHGMGIGPLKRLFAERGHLRLAWWEGNEAAKGRAVDVGVERSRWVHPAAAVRGERDSMEVTDRRLSLTSGRDGAIALLPATFHADTGFILEGRLEAIVREGRVSTHQKGAAAGFFFERDEGEGYAVVADALGRTRGGTLRFADRRITSADEHAEAGAWLMNNYEGPFRGFVDFRPDDQVTPIGHASYAGIRHGRSHRFRIVARGDFAELYVDDYYVQTYLIPIGFTGRVGLLAFDGMAVFSDLEAWEIDL
jgi:hypothetical protein